MDLNKVRKALGRQTVEAGEPGQLDPAVGPHGGTHDTDIEIADDVVKLVDVWPDGFAQELCYSIVRARYRDSFDEPALLQPGQVREARRSQRAGPFL